MKVEKFKLLLYLKKSGLDKSGKAPIMGRVKLLPEAIALIEKYRSNEH